MKISEEILQAIKHKGLNCFRLTDRIEAGQRVKQLCLFMGIELPFNGGTTILNDQLNKLYF